MIEADPIATWLKECCEIGKTSEPATFSALYDDYLRFTASIHKAPLSIRAFGEQLTDRGFSARKGLGGVSFRQGLRLVPKAVAV